MNFDLDDAALFLRIAELGNLSAAARERNWPPSQVSRALARLETQLAVRLIHRTTHGLSLTDEGDTFARHARQLLLTRDELSADLTGRLSGPSGWVRVGVSPALAESVIAPSLPGLYTRYPALHIDIAADDRVADMAREGIDIAIRTGAPHGDNLIARQIGTFGRTLCASPAYVVRHGAPQKLEDLAQHHLIASSVSPTLNDWPLASPTRPSTNRTARLSHWHVQGHTRSDSSSATLALVLHGVGIARLADLVAQPHLTSGALLPLLPGVFDPQQVPVFAIMLPGRNRLPKVRACIDWWQHWLATVADNATAAASPSTPNTSSNS